YAAFPAWAAFAAGLKARSLQAWDWAMTHPRDYKADTGEIKSGLANRNAQDHDRLEFLAAVHLWALTGDPKFHAVIRNRAPATHQLGEGQWGAYGVVDDGEALGAYAEMLGADPALVARIRERLAQSATDYGWAPPATADLYRAWMYIDAYHWGSSTPRASYGVGALQAVAHGRLPPADQARLRQRALDLLHSFHGVNPLSMVHLTNMGRLGAERSVTRIWNERFNFNTPYAANPPPGYVTGGPNHGYDGKNKDGEPDTVGWVRQQPRGKAYADFNEPWPLNAWALTENAIYYQAAYIRLLAHFVGK
ncbi:MAG TPA: glycoside hydrolase family 9 protein, partial [Polyangia bacterium]|nr:glycoside hydrolase family 9 protein [Polyangia bacterium]